MIKGGITTLYVADMQRSIHFYTRILGLTLRRRAGNDWAEVVAGEELVLGLHPRPRGGGAAPASTIRIGLRVEGSIYEAVEGLAARGVEFSGPVEDGSPVRLAFFEDPDKTPLYLYELVAAGEQQATRP